MGIDRGSRGGGSGGQHGYRGQRSGWGRESDSRYNEEWPVGNGRDGNYGRDGADSSSKYDKYEEPRNGGRRGGEENGHAASGGRNGGSQNGHGVEGVVLPQAVIASLEKKITSTQAEMTQELNNVTGKENEKFDLIFGILIELQRRQAQLEESVRSLRQMPGGGGMSMMQPLGPPQAAQGQQGLSLQQQCQNFMPQGQMGNQMGNQMGSQTNGQMFMPNQMNMGQQYGNMVAPDGSQAFFGQQNVVLVAQPVGMAPPQGGVAVGQGMQGQSMQPFGMPQMMSAPMQPQMAMQFVSQEQSGGNFQWGGADNSQQDSARINGQMGTMNAAVVTPEAPADGLSTSEQQDPVVDGQKAQLKQSKSDPLLNAFGDEAELRIEEE